MDLERKAYLNGEKLKFEAAVAQAAYNYMRDVEEGNPSFHYMRGIFRDKIEKCERLYDDGEVILEAAEDLDIRREKEPEEKLWMRLNQFFDYSEIDNRIDGINEALNSHVERVEESAITDVTDRESGITNLRSRMLDYSEFLEIIEEEEIVDREAEIQERFREGDQAEFLYQADL